METERGEKIFSLRWRCEKGRERWGGKEKKKLIGKRNGERRRESLREKGDDGRKKVKKEIE